MIYLIYSFYRNQILFKIQTIIQTMIIITIFITFFFNTHSFISYSNCNASQFYDYLTFSCLNCPNKTQVATDNTYCNCSLTNGYYHNRATIGFNHKDSCNFFASLSNTQTTISQFDINGASNVQIIKCSSGAVYKKEEQFCQPCTRNSNMKYNQTLKWCECNNPNEYPINGVCYKSTNSSFSNPYSPTTQRQNYIAYNEVVIGCLQYNLQQPCQKLINMCVNSFYSNSSRFCNLSNTYKLTKPTDSLGISASAISNTNTTYVQNQLDFLLVQYNSDGSLSDIKPIDQTIMPCQTNDEDQISFQSFGRNFYKYCVPKSIWSSGLYDLYVRTNINQVRIYQVPILYASQYYKRYNPSRPYTQIQMQFVSVPPLDVPVLQISLGSGSIAKIETVSSTSNPSIPYLIPLIIFLVITICLFVYNFHKYMRYNPDETNDPYFCFKVILLALISLIRYAGVGLWFYLLGISGYLFIFYKLQQIIYFLVPENSSFYDLFMAIFYIQCGFIFFNIIMLLFDLSTYTDYFMIDWEKDKNVAQFDLSLGNRHNLISVSVWRKILLVNQLYEVTINTLINTQFMLLLSVVFLEGLKWIDLAYLVPTTDLTILVNANLQNRHPILVYFIITSIIFFIALCQYIVRKSAKIWFPLPDQNFVDLCSLSNISLVIFDQNLHGYYLHGVNPLGQSEGSLSYIDQVFEKEAKSFGKSRSFTNDEEVQTFEVVFPMQIRQNYQLKYKSKYLQKLTGRALNNSPLQKPISGLLTKQDYEEIQSYHLKMVESFKFYLEGVKTSPKNIQSRNFLENIINCPLDISIIGPLPIFFKDFWNQFTNVFLQGHEFLLIINLINFANLWYLAFKSIFIALLLAYAVHKLLVINLAEFMIKRNISRNTMVDDKFFN